MAWAKSDNSRFLSNSWYSLKLEQISQRGLQSSHARAARRLVKSLLPCHPAHMQLPVESRGGGGENEGVLVWGEKGGERGGGDLLGTAGRSGFLLLLCCSGLLLGLGACGLLARHGRCCHSPACKEVLVRLPCPLVWRLISRINHQQQGQQ